MIPGKKGVRRGLLIDVAIVALFCLVFAVLALCFLQSASPTFDENVYLPAGYTYLKWHDYRIDPEHPPLVKKLAALPMLTQPIWPTAPEPNEQDLSHSRFFSSERLLRFSWANALKYPNSQWNFCHQFLYGPNENVQRAAGVDTPLLIPSTTKFATADFHNDVDRLLFGGRLIILLLGVATALIVYLWARELHGAIAGGVLAIALFVFDPNFIAHSGLIVTDVPLAGFMAGAMFFYWRLCRRFARATALFFLVFFALAFTTKFSAVLLFPIFWLIGIGRIFNPSPWPMARNLGQRFSQSSTGKASLLLILFVGACTVTWGVIWSFYGFRYSAAKDPGKAAIEEERVDHIMPKLGPVDFRQSGYLPIEQDVRRAAAIKSLLRRWPEGNMPESVIEETMKIAPIGAMGRLLLFANHHKLLPESYVGGFANAEVISLMHPSYLRGQYSAVGFKSYFLWTFVLKTPLSALIAVIGGLYLAIARKMSWRSDLAFLVIPVAVYLVFAVTSNLNIGHRHLLPIYPFLYVLAGRIGKELTLYLTPIRLRWAAIAGLGAIAVSSSFVFSPPWRPQPVFPHYLAYFNELAGGPREGWRSLVDSNIDWGQDLKGLRSWLDQAQLDAPVYLCYFGTADPRYYQIRHKAVPRALGGYPPTAHESDANAAINEFVAALRPGDHIAISVHNLVGPSLSPSAREVWKQILEGCTLIDRIGYSIFIFEIKSQPE